MQGLGKPNMFYSELALFTKYGPKMYSVVELLQILFAYMSATFKPDATTGSG